MLGVWLMNRRPFDSTDPKFFSIKCGLQCSPFSPFLMLEFQLKKNLLKFLDIWERGIQCYGFFPLRNLSLTPFLEEEIF